MYSAMKAHSTCRELIYSVQPLDRSKQQSILVMQSA